MNKSISNKGRAIKASNKQKPRAQVRADRPIPAKQNEQKVSAPINKGRVVRQNKPRTTPMPNGDILVRHREFVVDASSAAAFTAVQLELNPGLPGSFPWLSTLARSYESYRFDKLSIMFETSSPTTSSGKQLLAIDYDSSDAAPTTKQQAMAYRSSVSCPVWSDCEHISLPEDLNKRKSYFVRAGDLAANQDVKLYDVGNLFICSQGGAGVTSGEIYIDYEVRLMTPQLGKVGVGQSIYGLYTGSANSAPFASKSGNLPATVVSGGTTTSVSTWTFTQPWEGYVSVNVVGTTLAGIAPTGTGTELELADVINSGTTNEVAIYSVVVSAGETFILTISNATISACSAYFAQADA
jgi:hypothetical protein